MPRQRLYVGTLYGKPCMVKERFAKQYRHPELDAKLTHRRILQVVRNQASFD